MAAAVRTVPASMSARSRPRRIRIRPHAAAVLDVCRIVAENGM